MPCLYLLFTSFFGRSRFLTSRSPPLRCPSLRRVACRLISVTLYRSCPNLRRRDLSDFDSSDERLLQQGSGSKKEFVELETKGS
ncbi:hypothetical protein TIFTF001_027324 [Ficus carica]|uniref:Uncharacterized protein n=1 Tax=Ficus carica TaxID=3494 RepID=A0AA88DMU9_FICCA|nr:hypothetical protein TIFTF001_027324 [Ficus carica]